MNEKKLEIIKKILGVHEWTLREDRDEFPHSIFVFDGNGRCIMEYDEKNGKLFYNNKHIHRKIKSLFGFNDMEIKEIMKFLVEEHFKWEVGTTAGKIWRTLTWWRNILNGR